MIVHIPSRDGLVACDVEVHMEYLYQYALPDKSKKVFTCRFTLSPSDRTLTKDDTRAIRDLIADLFLKRGYGVMGYGDISGPSV